MKSAIAGLFTLIMRVHGGDQSIREVKLVRSVEGCFVEEAAAKQKLSDKICASIAALATKAKADPNSPMTPHSPHFEILYSTEASTWTKNTPLSSVKACDRHGVCESNEDLMKSQARLQELAQAVLKVSKK